MSGKKVGSIAAARAKRNAKAKPDALTQVIMQRIEQQIAAGRRRAQIWKVAKWGAAVAAVICVLIWIAI